MVFERMWGIFLPLSWFFFYWKLSHLNKHIVLENFGDRRLSFFVVRAIRLINMIKIIFRIQSTNNESNSKCMKWKKKEIISDMVWLWIDKRDNDDDRVHTHKRGAEEFELIDETITCCDAVLWYNFNENYHCHVRNVRSVLLSIWFAYQIDVFWVCMLLGIR